MNKAGKVSRIRTGDMANISGPVNIAGGDIKTQQKVSIHYDANAAIVALALKSALAKIGKRPKTTRTRRTRMVNEVKAIGSELEKKKVDKGFLAERFQNLAKMAPDILDVIITSLGSPAAGLGLTMKKIAEKVKTEAEKEAAKR